MIQHHQLATESHDRYPRTISYPLCINAAGQVVVSYLLGLGIPWIAFTDDGEARVSGGQGGSEKEDFVEMFAGPAAEQDILGVTPALGNRGFDSQWEVYPLVAGITGTPEGWPGEERDQVLRAWSIALHLVRAPLARRAIMRVAAEAQVSYLAPPNRVASLDDVVQVARPFTHEELEALLHGLVTCEGLIPLTTQERAELGL